MKTFIGCLNVAIMISLLLITHVSDAQHWEWAKAGHTYPHRTEDVTTDASGNIYLVHRDFDNEKIAVSKLNPQGTVLWNNEIGCCAILSHGMRIAVNNNGNVFVLGEYEGSIQFGNISLQTNAPGSDERYTFLAKLNTQGNVLWAKNAAGPTYGYLTNLQERDVVVDANGKILITGTVKGNAYFNNTLVASNSSLPNAFVAKYNANGSLSWVQRASGGGSNAASLDTDEQGNIYAIGYYNGAGGALQWGNVSLPLPSQVVSYFVKIGQNGNVQWAKRIGAKVEGIATSSTGSSYITGYITGTANMGNNIFLTSAGGADMVVARYNENGNTLWARSGGGSAPDYGYDIDIDQDGICYVVGGYQSATASFGTALATLPSGLDGAGFVARYQPNGSIKWVETIMPNDYTKAERISTTADGKGHILTNNKYSGGTLQFGDDITLNNAGGNDVIAKLDGHFFKLPIIEFYEAFICFPCFPFDPVLDYEYRFWAERTGIRGATYRKTSDLDNRDHILRKGERLEVKLHDELPEGIHYFQLRAIMRDGTTSGWTKAVAFELANSNAAALVYPNPVKDRLTIAYRADYPETISIKLFDRYGRLLLQQINKVQEGKNTFQLTVPPVKQDANPLTLRLQSKIQGINSWQLIRE